MSPASGYALHAASQLPLRDDPSGARFWEVHLRDTMLSYFEVPSSTRFESHAHPSEQITHVLEGSLFFELGEELVEVRPGEVIALDGMTPHAVFTRDAPCRAVDAWSPVPEQYAALPSGATALPEAVQGLTMNSAEARRIFASAPFIADLGMQLESLSPGECATSLRIKPRHLQQDGFVHAGILATMGDHTAGGAGATLLPAGHQVLSLEFKINLLRPAKGDSLRCRAKVLKSGRRFIIVESEVFSVAVEGERLAAKATVTLAVVPSGPEPKP